MKEQLISLETAKLAKDKGFNINIKKSYVETIEHTLELGRGGDCTFPYIAPRVLENRLLDEWHIEIAKAPTQSLLQKWLREVHNIDVIPRIEPLNNKYGGSTIHDKNKENFIESNIYYTLYEEALEQGLIEGLKLVK